MKIEHRFSFFIFLRLEKNKKLKINCQLFIFHLQIKKKMKIGHRFSVFIFQLAEKMNNPKIQAFRSVQLGINQRGKKKGRQKNGIARFQKTW